MTMERPLLGLVEALHEFEGGPDAMWYWIRGHVDKGEFLRELRLEYGQMAGIEDVHHSYSRFVPVGPQTPGLMTVMQTRRGRGAFPVTMLDADKCLPAKEADDGGEH